MSDTDDPGSPFYTLNAGDFVADRYRTFPISDAEVDAQRSSVTTLRVPKAAHPNQ